MPKFAIALFLFVFICIGCAASNDADDDGSQADDDDSVDDDDDDDDDNNDDNDDDDFVPPLPVFAYYDEFHWDDFGWVEDQLPVFAQMGLSLFLGMRDVDLGDPALASVIRAAHTQGVEVRAWILLPVQDGYWAGKNNAQQFSDTALAYADWFVQESLPVQWIIVDMEININTMAQVTSLVNDGQYFDALELLWDNRNAQQFDLAAQIYQQMVDDLEALGFTTMVVTFPQVLDDMEDEDTFIQDVIDCVVSPVEWHEVSTMVYSTTFENITGMSFGPGLVYDYALSTLEYFGDSASIALGLTRDMDDPQQLAEQVAASKAAGIDRIQIYAYADSIEHPNPDLWHAAFEAQAAVPASEPSTAVLRGLVRFVDILFE